MFFFQTLLFWESIRQISEGLFDVDVPMFHVLFFSCISIASKINMASVWANSYAKVFSCTGSETK